MSKEILYPDVRFNNLIRRVHHKYQHANDDGVLVIHNDLHLHKIDLSKFIFLFTLPFPSREVSVSNSRKWILAYAMEWWFSFHDSADTLTHNPRAEQHNHHSDGKVPPTYSSEA